MKLAGRGTHLPTAAYAAALAALSLLVLLGHGTAWRGEWAWTFDHCLGTTVLTGPAVASGAAWRTATERRRAHLTDSTVRGWLVSLRCGGSVLVVGVAVYVGSVALAAILTLTVTHGGPARPAVLLMGLPILAWYAAVGVSAGAFLPGFVTVPVVAFASFAIGAGGGLGIGPNFLRLGPATGSLAGLTWSREVLAGQGVLLIGSATVVLAAEAARRVPWRARTLTLLTAGLVVACAGCASLERNGDYAFVVSSERPDACQGVAPAVCVAPSNVRVLASLADRVDEMAASLSRIDVELPARYVQIMPYQRPSPGDGFLDMPAGANHPAVSFEDAAEILTQPAPCAGWSARRPWPARAFEARALVRLWLLDREGLHPDYGIPGARAWLRSDRSAVTPWVRQTFEALLDCDLDGLRLPWQAHGH